MPLYLKKNQHTMYQIVVGNEYVSSACHTKEFAKLMNESTQNMGKIIKAPAYMIPTFTILHEFNLLKLLNNKR